MLSAAIDSIAIYYVATRDLFEEDLQSCNSDFIDPSKLLLASSLSPSPIDKQHCEEPQQSINHDLQHTRQDN